MELHHAFSSTLFTDEEGLWQLLRWFTNRGIRYSRTVCGNPRHIVVSYIWVMVVLEHLKVNYTD